MKVFLKKTHNLSLYRLILVMGHTQIWDAWDAFLLWGGQTRMDVFVLFPSASHKQATLVDVTEFQ